MYPWWKESEVKGVLYKKTKNTPKGRLIFSGACTWSMKNELSGFILSHGILIWFLLLTSFFEIFFYALSSY
jgi:hypothetical protein